MKFSPPQRSKRLSMTHCHGGTAQYASGESLGPRKSIDFEAVLIIEGHPCYEYDGQRLQLAPGSLMITHPGRAETYFWDNTNCTRHAYLHFGLNSIPKDWPILDAWPELIQSPSKATTELLKYIIEAAISNSDWASAAPDIGSNRLLETFIELYLSDRHRPTSQSDTQLSEPAQRAIQFIHEQIDSDPCPPFSLEAIAKAANVTPKHLCRIFQNELKQSPMKTCRMAQFELAIPLLSRSNLPINRIANRCGFDDPLYFSRSFKKTFGQSPSEMRQSMRNGQPPPRSRLPGSLMPRLHY